MCAIIYSSGEVAVSRKMIFAASEKNADCYGVAWWSGEKWETKFHHGRATDGELSVIEPLVKGRSQVWHFRSRSSGPSGLTGVQPVVSADGLQLFAHNGTIAALGSARVSDSHALAAWLQSLSGLGADAVFDAMDVVAACCGGGNRFVCAVGERLMLYGGVTLSGTDGSVGLWVNSEGWLSGIGGVSRPLFRFAESGEAEGGTELAAGEKVPLSLCLNLGALAGQWLAEFVQSQDEAVTGKDGVAAYLRRKPETVDLWLLESLAALVSISDDAARDAEAVKLIAGYVLLAGGPEWIADRMQTVSSEETVTWFCGWSGALDASSATYWGCSLKASPSSLLSEADEALLDAVASRAKKLPGVRPSTIDKLVEGIQELLIFGVGAETKSLFASSGKGGKKAKK